MLIMACSCKLVIVILNNYASGLSKGSTVSIYMYVLVGKLARLQMMLSMCHKGYVGT